MADLGRLAIVLGLDSTEFTNGLTKSQQKAKDSLGRIEKDAQKSVDNIGGYFKGLAGVISVAALATGFKSLVDEMDQVGEAAERVGVTVESFSALSYAAKLSATDAATLEQALARVNLAAANFGNDIDARGGAEIEALGIKIKDAAGEAKSADVIFVDIAERLSQIGDQATKTAFANKIFGNGIGGQLIPLLNQGASGIRAMTDEAREMGIVIGTDAAEAAGKFNDKLDKTSASLTAIGRGIAQDVLPYIDSLLEKFDAARKSSFFAWLTTSGKSEQNPGQRIMELSGSLGTLEKQLTKMQKLPDPLRNWNELIFGDEGDLKVQIDAKKTELDYLKQIQNQRAKILTDEAASEARGLARKNGYQGPKDPKLPGGAKDTKEKTTEGDRLIKSLQDQRAQVGLLTQAEQTQAKLSLIAAKEITPAQKELAMTLARGIDTKNADMEATKKNQEALDEWIETIEKNEQRLDDLTGKSAIEQRVKDVQMLNKAYADGEGSITFEEYERGINSLWGTSAEKFDEIGEFALQAARNIQSALGQGLFDILDGKFTDIGTTFGNMLKRMAAEAAAAQLSKYLFGSFDKTGAVGGLAGTLLSSLGFGGGKAVGGPTPSNSLMRVNENGPEVYSQGGKDYLITGSKSGSITPVGTSSASPTNAGSGMIVNIHNNNGSNVQARQSMDSNGMPRLDVLIDQIESTLAGRAAKGQGPLAKANEKRYGLRPRLT